MDSKKIVIVAQKKPQRITFCPKFKFGIFNIYLNRIWNLSSIIPHLQANLKRDLFFYPDFHFINLMMRTCFYYIYHRIPKNTSIELKLANVCVLGSVLSLQNIRWFWANLRVLWVKNTTYSLRGLGGSTMDPRAVFGHWDSPPPRFFFVSPSKKL